MIAALYVAGDGCYHGLPHVDPWGVERDARNYAGAEGAERTVALASEPQSRSAIYSCTSPTGV